MGMVQVVEKKLTLIDYFISADAHHILLNQRKYIEKKKTPIYFKKDLEAEKFSEFPPFLNVHLIIKRQSQKFCNCLAN